MALSYVAFSYSGGPQVFPTNFSLGILSVDHIQVTVDGELDGQGEPLLFAFTYSADTGEVTVTDTLPNPSTGRIARITPKDILITKFTEGDDVTKKNLDRSVKQSVMVSQEVADDANNLRTEFDLLSTEVTDTIGSFSGDIDAAEAAALDAETSASLAATSETNAAASETKAELWAQEAEGIEVEPNLFSAFHWAQQAAAQVEGPTFGTFGFNMAETTTLGDATTLLTLGTAAFEADTKYNSRANNLSDVANAATARTNLGLGTAALSADTKYTFRTNNLSDVASAATARTNLGLGVAATLDASADNDLSVAPSEVALRSVVDANLGSGGGITILPAQATTSGTQIDFTIPTGAKEIIVTFNQVTQNPDIELLIQLGDSGGIETTGYDSTSMIIFINSGGTGAIASVEGFIVNVGTTIAASNGNIHIVLQESDTWISSGVMSLNGNYQFSSGVKSLSAPLRTLRVVNTGTASFTGGKIGVTVKT